MSDTDNLASLRNEIKNLQNTASILKAQVESAKKDVQAEVVKLERLRNEETHIEGELRALSISKSDHENQKSADAVALGKEKSAIAKREQECAIKESNTIKCMNDASESLKQVSQKLSAAEAIEQRNTASLKQIELKSKEVSDSIAKSNELLAQIAVKKSEADKATQTALDTQKKASDMEKSNSYMSDELHKEVARIAVEHSQNLKILKDAELEKKQAQELKNAAEEKAKASQLSVDRQYNEIEIQKKKLEVITLRLEKLAKDKGLEKELQDLKAAK